MGAVAYLAAGLLVIAFVFGGASREHALRLAIVELAALPLLAVSLNGMFERDRWSDHRALLWLLAGVVAVPLLQLVPLPPGLWTALPGREQAATALTLSGIAPGWLPLSLTPDLTWQAFLALIPPVAMLLAVLTSGPALGRLLLWICLGAGIASVMLGAAQLGSASDVLYAWRTTDPGNVVGAFANRNHFVTLCLATLPFAVALATAVSRKRGDTSTVFFFWGLLYVVIMVLGIGASRSRFGLIFLAPVVIGTLAAAWIGLGRGRSKTMLIGVAGAAVGAAALVGTLALRPILSRFNPSASEARFENWPVVVDAAQLYQPAGSGIGSFDRVYRAVEPLERLSPKFFNHAHNEYLEVWLEAGVLGVALIVAFVAWWARRSWTAWFGAGSAGGDLQRAASLAILVMLMHSSVDYPLRTATLSVFFALCCGILEFAGRVDAGIPSDGDSMRTRRRRRRVPGDADGSTAVSPDEHMKSDARA